MGKLVTPQFLDRNLLIGVVLCHKYLVVDVGFFIASGEGNTIAIPPTGTTELLKV